jgi:hypothetical protein
MSVSTTPRLNMPIPGGTIYDARLGDIDAVLAALVQLDGIIYGIQQDLAAKQATGPTGPAGPQGIPGIQGPQGPTGSQGPTGPTGANGYVGSDGATGATGPRGLQGIDGPAGPQGPTGANGYIGTNGATGATGPQGATGTWSGSTTDNLTEGTVNKYYTAARAIADVGAVNLALSGDITAASTPLANGTIATTLSNTGVTPGVYGDATNTPQITVNAKGRVTGLSVIASTPPSTTYTGDATGSGTGTIALTLAASGVTAGNYGDATHVPQIQVDSKGRITLAGTAAISVTSTTTQVWGTAGTTIASTAFVDRLRDVPQTIVGAYTLALADRGTCLEASGNITIPANSAVAFPIGTVIQILNTSASPITITVTTDTMKLVGTATTGTRTLAVNGLATLMKRVNATTWLATGVGLF